VRLVSITCVKNEYDIIESCIRHTAAFVDRLVVLDNGSTDGTLEILRKLEASGIPIEIVDDPAPGHYHFARATRLMREFAVKKYNADWILPVDADEFVSIPDASDFRNSLSKQNRPINLKWQTYIPDPGDDPGEKNPVLRIRHRLAEEAQTWFKVIVPGELARKEKASLTQGNHAVQLDGKNQDAGVLDGVSLAHFPVRSPGQYAAKVALMYLQTRATAGRDERWQWHYNRPFEILKKNPDEFARRFREFALGFAVKPENPFEPRVTLDPLPYLGGPLSFTSARKDDAVLIDNLLEYAETLARRSAEIDEGRS
jgi:glycosyltransferase involved in cell wall biosynthesis